MLQWSGASVRTDTSPRLSRTRCSRTSTTRWPSADSSTMGYQAPRRRMSATLSAQRAQPSLIRMRSRLTSYHVLIDFVRSEEHTSELQSPYDLVCRLLLEK